MPSSETRYLSGVRQTTITLVGICIKLPLSFVLSFLLHRTAFYLPLLQRLTLQSILSLQNPYFITLAQSNRMHSSLKFAALFLLGFGSLATASPPQTPPAYGGQTTTPTTTSKGGWHTSSTCSVETVTSTVWTTEVITTYAGPRLTKSSCTLR